MRIGSMVLALAMMTAVAAHGETLERTFDRTFAVIPGARFALANTNGRVTLHAWDQPQVRVHALERVRSRDAEEAKKAFAALTIAAASEAGGVKIETRMPQLRGGGLFEWIAGTNVDVNVDYEITVPRSMDVRIDNTNGAIEIAEVRGSMLVSDTNGHIECRACAGNIDAETTNGAIRVELVAVTPGRPIRLETTNGGVRVVVPRSISARIDASTTNGSVDTELPVTTTRLERHALRGTVNGGGSELRIRSTNGSISIEAR